jgi:hypothetical protein
MQDFANEIFRSMAKQGSAPRLLSINPSGYILGSSLVERDAYGHRWPEYNYTSGQLTGTMGKSEVVAVPLKAARSEFPNNWTLQHTI